MSPAAGAVHAARGWFALEERPNERAASFAPPCTPSTDSATVLQGMRKNGLARCVEGEVTLLSLLNA